LRQNLAMRAEPLPMSGIHQKAYRGLRGNARIFADRLRREAAIAKAGW
jgi:hypothetical protein